jgi:hypothetical protein
MLKDISTTSMKQNLKLAGDQVMQGLINVCAPQVKGAHDADFVIIDGKAYIVYMANDQKPGEIDVFRDGKNWQRKYRFETEKSFQYPTFREYDGSIYLTVTQGDSAASRKERIMFGKLE